jgi:hypothetical protein
MELYHLQSALRDKLAITLGKNYSTLSEDLRKDLIRSRDLNCKELQDLLNRLQDKETELLYK